MKKTKLICTLGPSSSKPSTIRKMIEEGMNAARINTAHGDFNQYADFIAKVRSVSDIPIIIDIKGPDVRLNMNYQDKIEIKKGDTLEIFDFRHKNKSGVYFNYNISKMVDVGDKILFNDGNLRSAITKKGKNSITVKFQNTYGLKKGVGVNILNKSLDLPSLSKKDLVAIKFAKKLNIEYIALSFVRYKKDVLNLKKKLANTDIKIISKIENHEGVENIDEIIDVSDGVMVARGDMGIELPSEKVPLIQKEMIKKSIEKGKLVIVATQMLESMVSKAIPTRAETSDVANAILDKADCVMLSEETASGSYPIEAVKMITKIAKEVEPEISKEIDMESCDELSELIAASVHNISNRLKIDRIVTITDSSYTTRMVSRLRPKVPIIAVTDKEIIKRQMELLFGVIPVFIGKKPKTNVILNIAMHCYKKGLLKKEDYIIFAAKSSTHKKEISNMMQINSMDEIIRYSKMK